MLYEVITRYGTVILALIQAFATSIGFNRLYGTDMVPNATFADYLVIAIVLTAGTSFLMWLGEQITDKGIGNGISLIIFAGIVAGRITSYNVCYTKLLRVVINMGVGDAVANSKVLDSAVNDMQLIAGQKPVITRAKKSIAGFKLRENSYNFV